MTDNDPLLDLLIPPRKNPATCSHRHVEWEPIEITYDNDENEVTQTGFCSQCRRYVRREYTPDTPYFL